MNRSERKSTWYEDIRTELETRDKLCSLQSPNYKYRRPEKNPYNYASVDEFKRVHKFNVRKDCKFVPDNPTGLRSDPYKRFWANIENAKQCKNVMGWWRPTVNRSYRYEMGTCWQTTDDAYCAEKYEVPELLRPGQDKLFNKDRLVTQGKLRCNADPKCSWVKLKTSQDCFSKKALENIEPNIDQPPTDMPKDATKGNIEQYLFDWYQGTKRVGVPIVNPLSGTGNRCVRPSEKENGKNAMRDGKPARFVMPDANERISIGNDDSSKAAMHPSLPQSVVNMMMKNISNLGDRTSNRGMLAWHSTGSGKCHAKNTKILMHDGTMALVQNIIVGELIMGDDSRPRRVLTLGRGIDMMYDIIPAKGGGPFRVNSEHILCLKLNANYIIHMEVKEYLKLPNIVKKSLKGYRVAVDFEQVPVLFDPYKFGSVIASKPAFRIDGDKLTDYVNLHDGHIPHDYTRNTKFVRSDFLAGIIDVVGRTTRGGIELDLHDQRLSSDVMYLVRSLGLGIRSLETGSLEIYGKQIYDIPLRKLNIGTSPCFGMFDKYEDGLIFDFEVKEAGEGEFYGFTLTGNHRYLMGDFTVTHNTCTASGVIDAFWNSKKDIVFATSLDALAINPDYKFHECLMNMYPTWQREPYKGVTKADSLRLIGNAFANRGVRFLSFAKLSNRVRKTNDYNKLTNKKAFGKLFGGVVKKRKSTVSKTPKAAIKDDDMIDLNNTLLIIDEVHNLFRPLPTQRAQHDYLKEQLLDPKKFPGLKIVILTATPGDNINDVIMLLNMIRDPTHSAIKSPNIDSADDMKRFKEDIRGLISYYDTSADRSTFPVVKDQEPELFPMSDTQFEKYFEAYTKTVKEKKATQYEKLAKDNQLNKYWAPARRYSNMLYNLEKGMKISEFSSKIPGLLANVKAYPREKHYIYSAFYENRNKGWGSHGILAIANVLEKELGYVKLSVADAKVINKTGRLPDMKPRYILATQNEIGGSKAAEGDVVSKGANRNLDELVRVYNHPQNKNGDYVHVMLASQGFNEGIDLKAVRHIHMFEPLVTMASDKQTIGRAARYCSHRDLSHEEGEWTVTIHRYMSHYPVNVHLSPKKRSANSLVTVEHVNGPTKTEVEQIEQFKLTINDSKDIIKAKEEELEKIRADKHVDKDTRDKLKEEIKGAKMRIKDTEAQIKHIGKVADMRDKEFAKKQKELDKNLAKAEKARKKAYDLTSVPMIDEFIFHESRDRMKELLFVYQAMKEAAVDCPLLKEFHAVSGNKIKCERYSERQGRSSTGSIDSKNTGFLSKLRNLL